MIEDNLKATFIPYLKKAIELELKAQGHRDTGKLTSTAEVLTKQAGDAIFVEGWYEDYAKYVNQGVRASKIEAVKFAKAAIKNLTAWASRKGFSDPERAAYAIRQTQAREGMPTRGSYKYSSNGKRLDAFDDVLQSRETADELQKAVGVFVTTAVDSMIERNKKIALSS